VKNVTRTESPFFSTWLEWSPSHQKSWFESLTGVTLSLLLNILKPCKAQLLTNLCLLCQWLCGVGLVSSWALQDFCTFSSKKLNFVLLFRVPNSSPCVLFQLLFNFNILLVSFLTACKTKDVPCELKHYNSGLQGRLSNIYNIRCNRMRNHWCLTIISVEKVRNQWKSYKFI